MRKIVIYKSKYGSTRQYAQWISEELSCPCYDVKDVTINTLSDYDVIIYGGGLYAEVINGVSLITKNFEKIENKKLIVFSTGITPIEMRDYYDKLVVQKNFKPYMLEKIKVFNFLGKMVLSELSLPHKAALKTLKKIMSSKENPTEMEKLLIELCDADGDFSDRNSITPLIEYAKRL